MVLDVPYASDSDDDAERTPRGYSGALVSTSLRSDSSFRMPSPSRFSAIKPTKKDEAVRVRGRSDKSPSPDSSLDDLIDSFRASASSLKFSSTRDTRSTGPLLNNAQQKRAPVRPAPATGTTSILRHGAHPRAALSSSDDDPIGLSPMPKLNYVPKQKPSLSIPAPPKASFASRAKPPSKFQPVRGVTSTQVVPKPNRPKLGSPRKLLQTTAAQSRLKTCAPRSPSTPVSSNQSTSSSMLEEIESPDSDHDHAGELSVDELISQDLRQLRHLVSSPQKRLVPPNRHATSRSLTNEEVDQAFRRNTRFRVDDSEDHASSFRLYSPHDRPSSASSFRLEPVQSLLHKHHVSGQSDQDDHEDSFVEELRTMKAGVLKEKEKKECEQRKLEDEKKKNVAETPGALIGSLREAVDTIDKDLLLALRPFEKMKQDHEKEDAEAAAKDENTVMRLDLPLAAQALIEQLDQAFGGLTRQREADLKADEDEAAQAKAAEEAKKKDEDDKKAIEDAARRKQEEEILSMLPLRGKLMNTEGDIHDALIQLEVAETLSQRAVGYPSSLFVLSMSPQHDLSSLREYAIRRAQDIEDLVMAPAGATRAIDWNRSTFPIDQNEETEPTFDDSACVGPDEGSYSDIVKAEVMEKLDFTILKLKHALSIDQKDADEAAARQKAVEDETAELQRKESEERAKQEQMQSDATAARLRVMGMSSIEELPWVAQTDLRLRHGMLDDSPLHRLQSALDGHNQVVSAHVPSFFDDNLVAERFDRVRMMMEAPYLHTNYKAHSAPADPEVRLPRWQANDDMNRIPRRRTQQQSEDDRLSFLTRDSLNASPIGMKRSAMSNNEAEDVANLYIARGDRKRATSHLPSKRSPTKTHQEKLTEMKRAIHDLQANRREKAHWFRASARSR